MCSKASSLVKNFASTNYARDVYPRLNGLITIYKPPGVHIMEVRSMILERLCTDLNMLEPRPLALRLAVVESKEQQQLQQQSSDLQTINKRTLALRPNLADHPLVVGPRYLPSELRLSFCSPILGSRSSGIMVGLLGDYNGRYLQRINRSKFISIYQVGGQLGYGTVTSFPDGKIYDKAKYEHVRRARMDRLMSHILSSQQSKMFKLSSIPIDSQAAYEIAKAWPARPSAMAKWPMIFDIKCIHLKPPDFVIEMTVVNEDQQWLANLMNEIGVMLKSNAFCTSIRRIKYGPFTVNDALIEKDWYLQPVIDNIHAHSNIDLSKLIRQYKSVITLSNQPSEFPQRLPQETVDTSHLEHQQQHRDHQSDEIKNG